MPEQVISDFGGRVSVVAKVLSGVHQGWVGIVVGTGAVFGLAAAVFVWKLIDFIRERAVDEAAWRGHAYTDEERVQGGRKV